jgi:hypothetical protein
MTALSDLPLFSPTFAQHLQNPPPDCLYHYTSQDGLLGIVKSSTLWATNIIHMNDATEFHRPLNMLRERVGQELERREYEAKHFSTRNAARAAGAEGLVRRLKLLRGKLNKVRDTAICVACFCEDGDLLSQWRGYSGRGYGYSLGFNSALMKETTSSAGFILGECIYCPKRQQNIIDESLEYLLRPSAPDDEKSVTQELLAVLRFMGLFKHEAFRQEQEWRLISTHRVPAEKVEFRSATSMIIPYIAVDIGSGKNSCIEHVYVGPRPHMELSIASVRQLFFQQGLPNRIDKSVIPFRDW